jgi:hypothetical protein
MSETADERADRLLAVGLDVAVQIRDDAPESVARLLQALDRHELRDLVMLLAAGIDVDVPRRLLYAWWLVPTNVRELRPHGTHAAAARHRYRKEPLCSPCRESERERDRDRKRKEREAA